MKTESVIKKDQERSLSHDKALKLIIYSGKKARYKIRQCEREGKSKSKIYKREAERKRRIKLTHAS